MTKLTKDLVNQLVTQNPDLKGRRVVNAAPSVDKTDYVIKDELKDLVTTKQLDAALAFQSLVQNLRLLGLVTFQKVATFLNGVVLSLIVPPTDTATSVRVTKADGTTNVIVVNTTLSTPTVDCTSTVRAMAAAGVAPTAGAGVEIRYDSNVDAGRIVSINRSTATQKPLTITAVDLTLNNTNLSFFAGTPIGKQTLAAYSSSNRSATFTSTPASLATAATLADLNTLRASYEVLRAMCDDLRSKLQTTTLVG